MRRLIAALAIVAAPAVEASFWKIDQATTDSITLKVFNPNMPLDSDSLMNADLYLNLTKDCRVHMYFQHKRVKVGPRDALLDANLWIDTTWLGMQQMVWISGDKNYLVFNDTTDWRKLYTALISHEYEQIELGVTLPFEKEAKMTWPLLRFKQQYDIAAVKFGCRLDDTYYVNYAGVNSRYEIVPLLRRREEHY